MTKEEQEKKAEEAQNRAEAEMNGQAAEQPGAVADQAAEQSGAEPEATPSQREQYMNSYREDYPDMDADDEDAFYGQANKNYQELKAARQDRENLNGALKDYPELNDMVVMASRGVDPLVWVAENLGMDMRQMGDDPEFAGKMREALDKFHKAEADKASGDQQAADEQKAKEDEIAQNIQESAQLLSDIQQEKGLTDEECDSIFQDFFQNVIEDGRFGIVSKDTWQAFINSRNYDSDMETARKEAATKALNEKFQNNLHKTPAGTPPSIPGQGAAGGGRRGGFFSGVD